MAAWKVKKDVGNVKINDASLTEPCEPCADSTGSLLGNCPESLITGIALGTVIGRLLHARR